MMPPADRIYDPGQAAKKDLADTGDDFLAIGFFSAHDNNKCQAREPRDRLCTEYIRLFASKY